MINTNSLGILGQFYLNIKDSFKSIYQNSNFYEKKYQKPLIVVLNINQVPIYFLLLLNTKTKNIKLKTLLLIQFGKII